MTFSLLLFCLSVSIVQGVRAYRRRPAFLTAPPAFLAPRGALPDFLLPDLLLDAFEVLPALFLLPVRLLLLEALALLLLLAAFPEVLPAPPLVFLLDVLAFAAFAPLRERLSAGELSPPRPTRFARRFSTPGFSLSFDLAARSGWVRFRVAPSPVACRFAGDAVPCCRAFSASLSLPRVSI